MKISDRVLELLIMDQSTRKPLTDDSGAPLTMDVYEEMETVLSKIAPRPSFERVYDELAVIREYYALDLWSDAIFQRHLEANCADGRYLVSLMDDKGKDVPVKERYGLLDMKLHLVSENTDQPNQWLAWALISLENIYAYSGDGYAVLLSRLNVLQDFIDHYSERFQEEPDSTIIEKAAHFIVWNVFKFDESQEDCKTVMIMDWGSKKALPFISVLKGESDE